MSVLCQRADPHRWILRGEIKSTKKSSFSGDSYREYQEKQRKAAGSRRISTGRGTGSRKLTAAPKKASAKGRTRVTGRGTGTRKGTK